MVAPVRCATPGTDVACAVYPLLSARSTIQSDRTPPPSPPIARIATVIALGCVAISGRDTLEPPRDTALKEPNDGTPHPRHESFPGSRIRHDLRAIKRRAEHRSVRHLTAQTAADAAIEHSRDRVLAQRIGI